MDTPLSNRSAATRRTLHITRCESHPYAFAAPPISGAFALLLVITSENVTREEQAAISSAIVASGARWVAAWGHQCSTWDDSVDGAYLETDPDFNPPDETMVITTWHENESVEAAFSYLWMWGEIDHALPENVCAFFLGSNPLAESKIRESARDLGARIVGS